MENEKVVAKEIPNYLEAEVSDKETMQKLEPAVVQIMDFRVEDIQQYGNKLVLLCKHPEVKDKLIEISKVKYQVKDALKTSGLWLKMDSEGMFPKVGAIGSMLKHLNSKNLTQIKNTLVPTVLDENGYLAIKGY